MPSRAIIVLVAIVGALGAAAALTLPAREPPAPVSLVLLLASVSALAGIWPVRIGRAKVELTATHPLVLCALVVAGPLAATGTALAGVAATMLFHHRRCLPLHLPFNLGAVAVSTATAAWVFVLLGGGTAASLDGVLWPLLAATTVYFATNTALVSTALAIEGRRSVWASWRDTFAWTLASYLSGFTLAALLALVVTTLGPWGLMLAVPPCWLLIAFYRAHRERSCERQRRLDEVEQLNRELQRTIEELRHSTAHVRQLQGLIPICMHCKSIRDDQRIWRRLEEYLASHAGAEFTHSLCEPCRRRHYPEIPEVTPVPR